MGGGKLNRVLKGLGGVLIIVALGYGFLTMFVRGSSGGAVVDGLGRALRPAPAIARVVLWTDDNWPGAAWFLADLVVFWGCIGAAVALIGKSSESQG